ncbi:MAG: HPr family phosphocarrier protein [Kordiimonadales bacterium]|nr:MAG: HPr family phosphocarrier protein [Kordiimonadales bacterium]
MTVVSDKFEREVIICNRRGLHARASAKFAREAGSFKAAVHVRKDGAEVTGTSIMGLMMLGASTGEKIAISAIGDDAEVALDRLCAMVSDKFGEGE